MTSLPGSTRCKDLIRCGTGGCGILKSTNTKAAKNRAEAQRCTGALLLASHRRERVAQRQLSPEPLVGAPGKLLLAGGFIA
jgi:hypothetical protein